VGKEGSRIFKGHLIHVGGKAWRCIACGSYITADCECCEPPSCGCGERRLARAVQNPVVASALKRAASLGDHNAKVLLGIALRKSALGPRA
jgi:hypothetical protein